MTLLRNLFRDTRAASAGEFALVLPLLMIMLFGIIDAGRFFWILNKSEKATQVGARMAIVTDPVSPDLIDADFAGGAIKVGDLIPASSLGTIRCTSTGCSCIINPCPFANGAVDATAFNVVVDRMQMMNPLIAPGNVQIQYSGSGFGYAGSAAGGGGGGGPEIMEIHPLVTVRLTGMQFDFISLLGLVDITMPAASATLTAEDSSGTFSN